MQNNQKIQADALEALKKSNNDAMAKMTRSMDALSLTILDMMDEKQPESRRTQLRDKLRTDVAKRQDSYD